MGCCMFSPNTEWNLDITKGQGSGKICSAILKTSLYRVPFHIFYFIAISWFKKKPFVIPRTCIGYREVR